MCSFFKIIANKKAPVPLTTQQPLPTLHKFKDHLLSIIAAITTTEMAQDLADKIDLADSVLSKLYSKLDTKCRA